MPRNGPQVKMLKSVMVQRIGWLRPQNHVLGACSLEGFRVFVAVETPGRQDDPGRHDVG